MTTQTTTSQAVAKDAISVPATRMSTMPFKRGDILDVDLCIDSRRYMGVVRSASKSSGVYVIDANGAVQSYNPESSFVKLTLLERLGARKRETLFELAKHLH